jgi:hypothetical protein
MPKPKLPREVVDTVVELLLCGWTPQDVVASWPEAVTDSVECVIHPTEGSPSLSVVQRLAREQGLARPRGAQPGRPRPVGAGRKKGQTGPRWSPYREKAAQMRSEGLSYSVIAGLLGITRQGVQKILSDGYVEPLR